MTEPSAPSFDSNDPEPFERDGATFAHQAVQSDQAGQFETAAFYYTEAAQALLTAAFSGSQLPNITERARQYIMRGEELKKTASQQTAQSSQHKTKQQLELEKAKFLMNQAIDDDSAGNIEDAVAQYSEAVELCLKLKQNTNDKALEEKVVKLATQALDRAEVLKKKISPTTKSPPVNANPLNKPTQGGKVVPPLGFGAFLGDSDEEKNSGQQHKVPAATSGQQGPTELTYVGPKGYTKEEIGVLRTTSDINGRQYVPFMIQDMKEKFAFPVAFRDEKLEPSQVLNLSDKELTRLGVVTLGDRLRLKALLQEPADQENNVRDRTATEATNVSRELGSLFGPMRSRYSNAFASRSKKKKEKTWTGKFLCLSDRQKNRVPTAEEKAVLQRNGLGFKKIQFLSSDSEEKVKKVIMEHFPALENCGGFELLRCGSATRSLNFIEDKWDAKSLNESVGSQAHIYIRPIQKNILINDENNNNINTIYEKCLKCGQEFKIMELRNHIKHCGVESEEDDVGQPSQVYILPDLPPSVEPQQVVQIGSAEPQQVLQIQSSESQQVLQIQSAESQQVLHIHSTEPQQVLQIQSHEPQHVLQMHYPESQQVLQIQSPESQQMLQIQSPESQQMLQIQSPESQQVLQIQSPESQQVLQIYSSEPQQVLQIQSPEPGQQVVSADEQEESVFSQTSNEETVETIVLNTSMYCTEHNISDPLEILRVFQSKIVTGRPLDITDTSIVPEGSVNFIMVNRNRKLDCALEEIKSLNDLRLCLDVQYYDEKAVDFGGPRREFFADVLREINEKYFNPPREWSTHYETIGKIMALSLLQNCQLPKVMQTELLEEVFMKESSKPFVRDLRKGLDSLGLVQLVRYQPTLIHLFTPTSNALTVKMLLNMLKPKFAVDGSNKREREDTVYQKFVKYVREAASGRRSSVNLSKILRFATGAEVEPPLGFSIHPAIEFPHSENPLPTANTCINQLNLPIVAQEMKEEDQFSFYDLAFANEYFGLH